MSQRFSEQNAVILWEFDTSAKGAATMTNVNSTAWIDMDRWNRITCLIVRNVGTGILQDAGLYVSAASAGTNAVVIGSTTGSTTITHVWGSTKCKGTNLGSGAQGAGLHIIEASHDEIGASLSGGRYVSARISGAAAADEYLVCYILSEPRYSKSGMIQTADGTQSKAGFA
jgi:hypothetical protein